MNELLTIWSV